MNILITGDLVINRAYTLDSDLRSFFNNTDLNIVNLEAPVTTSTSIILKTGPHLKADMAFTNQAFKELKIDMVTLANNHVLDYDEKGVTDTLDFCQRHRIATVGAGSNLKEASKIHYINTKEGRLGIVNFAENEWASATEYTAGANPMDTIDNAKQIKEAKLQADYVFVIVHGGHEYFNLPSPRMQKQYRYYADCGADLVVGHHTHCISGFEVYNKVPIYYSLGNFLFTMDSKYEDWYTGLVLEIIISGNDLIPKLHPVKMERNNFKLSLLKDEDKNKVLNRITSLSKTINDEVELKYEWLKFVDLKYDDYLNRWSIYSFLKNRYLKAILRRLGIKGINSKGISSFLNQMRCEAHADLSKEIIQKYLSKN